MLAWGHSIPVHIGGKLECLEPLTYSSNGKSLDSTTTTYVLSSCDGLFCLVNNSRRISLMNPSTRQYNQLPPNPNNSDYYDFSYYFGSIFYYLLNRYSILTYYGFRYDFCSDDYKIKFQKIDRVRYESVDS